jgi:hypothetical protein
MLKGAMIVLYAYSGVSHNAQQNSSLRTQMTLESTILTKFQNRVEPKTGVSTNYVS